MDFHQQITLCGLQFPEADLQVSMTNLLNILSGSFLSQHFPDVVGKNQGAPCHSTAMLQCLIPGYREKPTAKRRAALKTIELPPGNQTRFLCNFFDIMPGRQQSAKKRAYRRLVFHQESYKLFVVLAVIRRGSVFYWLIIHIYTSLLPLNRLLPPVANLDNIFKKFRVLWVSSFTLESRTGGESGTCYFIRPGVSIILGVILKLRL